jgi:hypothetical protein
MENQPLDSIEMQKSLPNSTGVLVLGILSIVFCCCCGGVFGLILGIISLVLANQSNKLYVISPNTYTESSYKNMKGGKTCAIVGISIAGVYLISVISLSLNGSFNSILLELVQELIQELKYQ